MWVNVHLVTEALHVQAGPYEPAGHSCGGLPSKLGRQVLSWLLLFGLR